MKRTLESLLVTWKDGKHPLPLLLRGARQVGKSFLATEFGKKYFQDIAVIDFEQKPEWKSIFSSRDLKEIILKMQFSLKQKIIAAGPLLEFLLHDENFSFPVGRVDFLYLRPFSFVEAVDPFVLSYLEKFSLDSRPDEV